MYLWWIRGTYRRSRPGCSTALFWSPTTWYPGSVGRSRQRAIFHSSICCPRVNSVLHLRRCQNFSLNFLYTCNSYRVEATSVPNREARNADPQYVMMSPFGYSFYPQEIQPGFYGGPYGYGPFFLPFTSSNAQPVAGNRIFFNPILNAVLPPFLKQTSTSTVTLTAFAISTSTSVATCRPPPAVARCAGT